MAVVRRWHWKRLDIRRNYYGVREWTQITTWETGYLNAGKKIIVSFKPASNWADAGGGNSTINNELAGLAQSIGNRTFMICVWHEPQNDVGTKGTAAEYVAMWHNVRSIFDAHGATNIIWVWNMQGPPNQRSLVPSLWPGNTYVDWVTWDRYQGSSSEVFVNLEAEVYDWFVNNSDATHDYLSKPWGWAEWGVGINGYLPTAAQQITTFNAVKTAVANYQFPRVAYMAYYDEDTGPNAGSAILSGAQSAYNAFANSTYMKQQGPPQTIDPAVIRNPSGTLEVFAVHATGGSIDHIAQTSPNGGWGSWAGIAGSGVTKVVAGVDTNGNTVAFYINGTQVYYSYRLNGSSSFSSWASMASSGVYDIIVGTNFNGGLELFANGIDNNLYHIWESPAGTPNAWSTWRSLGYTGARKGMALAWEADTRFHVFCIGTNNALYHCFTYIGGNWTNTSSLGGSVKAITAIRNPSDQVQIFAAGTDGSVTRIWETTSNTPASWSAWTPFFSGASYDATHIVAATFDGTDGPELFFVGSGHNIYRSLKTTSWPSTPSNMSSQLSGTGQVSDNLGIGVGQNGGIEVYIVAPDSKLYHNYQEGGSGGNWHGFTGLAGSEL